MVPLVERQSAETIPICDWDHLGVEDDVPIRQRLNYDGEDPVVFCLENQLQTSSPLHRRSKLVEIGGFNEALPCSQERDLHLRLVCTGVKFVHHSEQLYRVRRQSASLSSDFDKILEQHLTIFLNAKEVLERNNGMTKDRQLAIAQALSYDGRLCVRRGMYELARKYFDAAGAVASLGATLGFRRWYSRSLATAIGPVKAERLLQSLARQHEKPTGQSA